MVVACSTDVVAVAVEAGWLAVECFLAGRRILRMVVIVHPLRILYSLYSMPWELRTELAVYVGLRATWPMTRRQLAEPGAELPLKAWL